MTNPTDDTAAELAEWAALAGEELEISGFTPDVAAVLELAGVAAHAVRRPAAPVTTYLLGIAVGRAMAAGDDPVEAAARASAALSALAERYGGRQP
ncbi:DUF6457 domain-containing protein [Herbiconiux sp. KACC 21604]|uniref:DUF6457 domain-containing protein n=1 Tax=unclassified Herbiconiux TaxID=2618217 RepID=UPI001490ADC9|nr:DUF6457 domain-containing protein [Herbiconiux sp. SALV-R1]QJU55058.1 hypothetical protein HL652_16505 [Herbiconiux sp. SALV-R1]WPO86199.1 DUF6457 domain-containing protein [Herbiconiux sp. KACC 21604]